MRSWVIAVLLCLTLAGCTSQTATQTASLPRRLSPTKETENDTLKCYRLDGAECRFFTLGKDLYLVAEEDAQSTLLRLGGRLLLQTASYTLPNKSCRISAQENTVICHDPENRQILLLNDRLEPTRTISLPEPADGGVQLSGDGLIYYAANGKLIAYEPDTGLHQVLRAGDSLVLIGLMEGALVCSDGSRTRYISCADGTLLGDSPPILAAARVGLRDCLAVKCGENDCLYLTETVLPLIPGMKFLAFLPEANAALVFCSGESGTLILYDLTTGNQLARTNTDPAQLPQSACATEDGRIFFRQNGCLYQWLPVQQPAREYRNQITRPCTSQAPDAAGLARCRQRSALLEQQYGFQIVLNNQATEILPPGCTAEGEHLEAYLMDALSRIENALVKLPTTLVRSAIGSTGKCHIGIVRSLSVNGEPTDHLQFWNGRDCCILLTPSTNAEENLLRCLSPMIDSSILSRTNTYDLWDTMNSPGFSYGAPSPLSCFADENGGISPTRDREELFLASMADGNRELFCDALLQKKLRQMCIGIRQAFPGIEQNRTLPWEQYLWEKL